jgi:methyltransferase
MVRNLPFWIFLFAVGLQRFSEIFISKRHARWMKEKGGVEFGRDHFKWVALLMALFFVFLPLESFFFQTRVVPYWWVLMILFLMAQALRYWAMASLGKFWNVRIWVIPGSKRIVKGPYRFIHHPNYAAVFIELLVIPLMIRCYLTAFVSVLGFLLFLRVRIPEEEKALSLLK